MKTLAIGRSCWIFMVLLFSEVLPAQTDSQHTTLSPDPLTTEQIAIYRAVILNYLRDSKDKLNIADTTESPDQDALDDTACVKGLDVDKTHRAISVHKLDSLAAGDPQLALVHHDGQEQLIEQNDPQKLLKRAIDDHQKVMEQELDNSIKKAFETGLFTLSEIVFDRQHRHAVVTYSFVCGGLCGSGNRLVLKKVGRKWKITKRCGGWVS